VKTRLEQLLARAALSGTSKIGAEENHEALVVRLAYRPKKKKIVQRDFLRSNTGTKRETNNTDKIPETIFSLQLKA
jgi:hypothetical protein